MQETQETLELLKPGDRVEPISLDFFYRNDHVRDMVVGEVISEDGLRQEITLKDVDGGHLIERRGGGMYFSNKWVKKKK